MPVWPGDDPRSIERAARTLVDGGLVALPTETVYGLAARADDDRAVRAVFDTKGRPSGHPLIVHVAGIDGARRFAVAFDGPALALAQAFWPGPVSVIVRRAPGVAAAAAAGLDTVALRCPAHPLTLAVLKRAAMLGVPGLAAPSANRFGRVSPTRASHVADEFGDAVPVLDGGECRMGVESTIVDCSGGHPALLRPGPIGREGLAAVLGAPPAAAGAQAPRAPGMLASHYAPTATLRLMDGGLLRRALELADRPAPGLAVYSRSVPLRRAGALARRMPDDAAAAARELFAVLRDFDAAGARLIWVETPPESPEWDAVRDRLQRAAAA